MEQTININQIVNEIEKLDYNDKINVMSRIVNLLKRADKSQQSYSITRLKGLGKNIWQKNDIDSYVVSERESWD